MENNQLIKEIEKLTGGLEYIQKFRELLDSMKEFRIRYFNIEDQDYYSKSQTMSILNVSERTLQDYRTTKHLIRYKMVGRNALHFKEDVINIAYLKIQLKNKKKHKREYEEMRRNRDKNI